MEWRALKEREGFGPPPPSAARASISAWPSLAGCEILEIRGKMTLKGGRCVP